MGSSIRESFIRIGSRARASSHGLMDASITADGSKVDKKASVSIARPMAHARALTGNKVVA